MSTPFELRRLSAGDVLERTIKLLRLAFSRIGVIYAVLAVPAALLFGVIMDGFFSIVLEMAAGGEMFDMGRVVGWVGFLLAAVVVLLLIGMVMLVSVQLIVCGEIVGRHISTKEAFDLTLGARLWRAVGQRVLAEMAVGLVLVVPYLAVLVAGLGLAAGSSALSVFGVILSVAVVIGAVALMLYLRVRWAFGTTAIAWEDESVTGAFGRSSRLVRGEWLRTFAILALFAILLAVAASVITLPVQIVIFKDMLMAGLNEARTVALQSETEMMRSFADVGYLYGITVVLANLFSTAVKSIYLPVLYFDLRARNGEFGTE